MLTAQETPDFEKFFKNHQHCQMEVTFNEDLQLWLEDHHSCQRMIEIEEYNEADCNIVKALLVDDITPVIQNLLNQVNDGRVFITYNTDKDYKEKEGKQIYACLRFSEIDKESAQKFLDQFAESDD
jgi:hypothetical protein